MEIASRSQTNTQKSETTRIWNHKIQEHLFFSFFPLNTKRQPNNFTRSYKRPDQGQKRQANVRRQKAELSGRRVRRRVYDGGGAWGYGGGAWRRVRKRMETGLTGVCSPEPDGVDGMARVQRRRPEGHGSA